MTTHVIEVLDPEIVIPSSEHATSLTFWHRMLEWSLANDMRIGPSTFSEFVAFAGSPPIVPGLPQHDLWAIIGRLSARGIRAMGSRPVCEAHVRARYSAKLGRMSNVGTLLDDLRALGPSGQVALGTDSVCWAPSPDVNCDDCVVAAVFPVSSPSEPKYSAGLAAAWRAAFSAESSRTFDELKQLSAVMFPNVEFSASAWDHVGTLSGDATAAVLDVVAHLRVLSEHVCDIWRSVVTRQGREAALGSLGITASPEGPRTHRNRGAMEARDFDFSVGVLRCEWHTKLNPNTDRIHFAVTDDRVFVGTIVDHLPV